MREQKRRYPTRDELLSVRAFDAPVTEPKSNVIKPRFRGFTAEAIRRAKQKLIAWHRAYRLAFEAFRRGLRDIEWPVGTFWFARYAGVKSCARE